MDPICEGADVGPPDDMAAADTSRETALAATNEARATQQDCGAQGMLGPENALSLSTQLNAAAQAHAADMAANESLGFVGSDGSTTRDRTMAAGYPGTMVIESIGSGFASADEAVSSWIADEGTCANLMNSTMQEMGFGHAVSAAGVSYWSLVLGQQ
jgi:uncharacterized protein YkwD